MKGVILAGGTGSRLLPLTKVTNKHLLPIDRDVMIAHPVRKLVGAGIRDILIVTGTEHMGDMVSFLGSGRDFGCEFTYRVQDEAGGIAQALGLARRFVGSEPFVVILGDNIFEDDLTPHVDAYRAHSYRALGTARILLKEVSDPERFGVAEVSGDCILSIEEKPRAPKSNLAVTGIYFYDARAFEFIDKLRPSSRGELEISDVNREYLRRGFLEFGVLGGWWTDAGTHESLARASELVRGLK